MNFSRFQREIRGLHTQCVGLCFFCLIVLFPTQSYAFDPNTQFKDYIQNGTQPATKKGMLKARDLTGNVLDFGRKANLAGLAVTVGVTLGAIYFEDQLNDSLYELFLGDQVPGSGAGDVVDNGSYQSGYVWHISASGYTGDYYATTSAHFAARFAGSSDRLHFDGTSWRVQYLNQFSVWTNRYTYAKVSCASAGNPAGCSVNVVSSLDDGVPFFEVNNGYAVQPAGETDQIPFPNNKWFEVETDGDQLRQRVKVEVLPNGNTRITSQTEYLDENGNLRTITDVTETNPAGNVVSQSTTDTEGGLDTAAAQEAMEGPADVNVLNDMLQVEVNDTTVPTEVDSAVVAQSYQGDGFQDTTDFINGVGAITAPSISWMPSLPAAGACQSFPFSFMGESVQIPGTMVCGYFEKLKDMLAYMLYILTAYSIFQIFQRPRVV